LGMARRTERHQAVEIEVRAPLGALDDVRYRAGSLELSPKLIMYQWLVVAWTTIRNLFCSFRFFTSRPAAPRPPGSPHLSIRLTVALGIAAGP